MKWVELQEQRSHSVSPGLWEEGVVSILLNWVLPFDPCPDPGHSLPGAWKPRGSWSGKSLNMSFLNKGLGLIHRLLDLGWKVNINPSGRLEQGLRNCAHLGFGSLQPGSAASGAALLVPGGGLSRRQLWGLPGPGPQPRLCCAWARRPLATPPALRGGRCPPGAPVGPQHQARPRCQSASLEGNKHVLMKTKHFQMGASCWNSLAAPRRL